MSESRGEVVIGVLGELARALIAGEPLDVALQQVATCARALANADLAAVTLIGPDRMLSCAAIDGAEAALYRGVSFPSEGTVTAEVMASGHVAVYDDIAVREGSQRRVLGRPLGPAMFTPITLDGPFGALNVFRFAGRPSFGANDRSLTAALAGHVSVVLEQRRLRERLEVSDRIAEQARIASGLYDSAVDQVFAASMALSSVVTDVANPGARERILHVIDDLDRAIKQIRDVAFGLGEPGDRWRA